MDEKEKLRRLNILKKILEYSEGHKDRLGYYPDLTANELKVELELDYKDIKFLLNDGGVKS